uniref:Ubiquitin-conjugating enzyme n=1 Tax=Starmerella bombicola TaxID=75736 RepID=A0A0U1YLH7_STABO|nr:ubiquitin-conjugating enzyme [Starmerella bombicola]
MASRMATKRLTLEYKSLRESPTPYIDARPSDQDILQWYYVITGPPDTPFAGGQYLGDLKFPPNYPYSPPSIRMLTPSGRFDPGARLCLNMSDFHPETWNPAWNVSTILTGLLSFMCSSEITTGAMQTSTQKKIEFSKRSVKWNMRNPIFIELFSDIHEEIKQSVPDYDTVATIEVIPPTPGDLVKRIHSSYRASAFEAAQQSARAIHKEHLDARRQNIKDDGDGGFPMQTALVVAGAVLAVVVAYAYLC